MKQYPLLNSKISKFLFGLYMLAMLFVSRDTLFSSCILGFGKSQFLMLGLIVMLGVLFLLQNRRNIPDVLKDRRMLALGAVALILLVPMLVKQDWQVIYFSMLICLLFAVFLTYFTGSR